MDAEAPVPRLILVTAGIANGIGKIVAKVGGVCTKPCECGSLFELYLQHWAARS